MKASKIIMGCVFAISTGVMADSLVASATNIGVATESEASHYPKPSATYVKAVQRYDIGQIKKLDVGLNKNQVRFLMGNPHFSEGLIGVHTWDYLVGLQKKNSNEYQLCQLRVSFDKNYLVNSLKWRDQSCHDLMAQEDVVVPTESAQETQRSYATNAILFNFNKSSINDVVGGEEVLDQVKNNIKSNIHNINRITVTGYADELGQSVYNQRLAYARAATIANNLAQSGLTSLEKINIESKGATNAFKSCIGVGKRNQVIQCLEPNRRVVVTTIGN
ncbi:outer membrane protein assembly factor BamE domain-containing protein [Acinetobacter nosocomialis]|uniref:outer membrane protein assembly factor BamE domain-containing protein n=1 Tax=Acinetobacter nosocomialis TaxID=106654 RepID=UPI00396F5510